MILKTLARTLADSTALYFGSDIPTRLLEENFQSYMIMAQAEKSTLKTDLKGEIFEYDLNCRLFETIRIGASLIKIDALTRKLQRFESIKIWCHGCRHSE